MPCSIKFTSDTSLKILNYILKFSIDFIKTEKYSTAGFFNNKEKKIYELNLVPLTWTT